MDPRTVGRRDLLGLTGAGTIAALAGCTGGGDDGTDGEQAPETEAEPVAVDDDATWRTTTLEDVTTGTDFTVASVDGPVLVHTFAIGCAVSRNQQYEFETLYGRVDDLEIVTLTTDPHYDRDEVREHTDERGFGWRFGVPSEDVRESLVADFGEDVTVSQLSPVVVVCPDGQVYTLETIVGAETLEGVLENAC